MTDVVALVDEMFADPERFGTTYAALVVRGDAVLSERYGGALPHFDGPDEPVTAETKLLSWSIAKSVLHVAVGVLVEQGKLDPDAPAAVPEWSAPDDPRGAITLEQLLAMRDGLDFFEDYVDERTSDVIEMLFGSGRTDVAHYAADRRLAHEPGSFYNYSSGTSNIIARIVGDTLGSPEAMRAFLRDEVFAPIGMPDAEPRFDDVGTFIASSYVYATARDWVRFGQCYLRGGIGADGQRVVPQSWVEHGWRQRSVDPDNGRGYGAHWWVLGTIPTAFFASGYEGQRIVMCPDLDLVIARFGRSSAEQYDAIFGFCEAVIADLAR